MKKLDDISEDDKQALLDDIAPNSSVRAKVAHQNRRRQYKLKLKKAKDAETKKGHVNAANC